MTGEHDSLRWTRSDAIAEAVSAKSCHVILETLSPECVEKISRYLESSAGHSGQDKVSNEPAAAESDSGDSLFITQKPVPEAVRSARPRHYSSRSDPISPRAVEESEEDSPSYFFHGESKTDRRRRKKKPRLPKYSFPFLAERERKPRSTLLGGQQNKRLHNYAMGGFFKCVKELWQDYGRGNLESSLPTVDMDEDYISPLSEQEERSEDEDIKVVERKHLVAPSKAKSRQTWWNQLKQQRATKACNARQEYSQGRHKLQDKVSILKTTVLYSETENSDDGESSCRVVVERERNDEHMASNGNFLAQTPKTNRQFQQNTREEELHNNRDATVREPRTLQKSPRLYTRKGRGASATVTTVFHLDDLFQTGQAEEEHESQHLHNSVSGLISDTNNQSETRVRKRKNKKKDKGDCESVGEQKGQGQSQEELEGLHATTSVSVEVDETPSLSEDNREKPPASQANDELEFNENNWMENSSRDDNILRQREGDIPDSKIKKKKRKKSKSTENVRQEVDGTFESDVRKVDSVFSVSCNVEHGGKQKKKKKKRSGEDDEAVEQSQASTVAQPLIDDANVMRKKKKRKKDERIVITEECGGEKESNRIVDLRPVSTGQLEDSGNCLENTAASQETFESRYVKRKKHKKREMLSSNEATQDGEDGVSFSNVAVTLAKSTAKSLKKKKRKTISEGLDFSHTPEINENVHQTPPKKEGIEEQIAQLGTKKKKKKKTLSEAVDVSCTPKEHDEVENVDNTQKTKEGLEDQNAEFVTKKKKKKKKTLSEAVDDSCILEENEEVENVDNTQKTKEGTEEQNAELVTKKKKKKKMGEVSSWNISKDSVAQSDDSVSVRKKEKKRTSSFLVADAEENDACTQDEQNSPGEYEPESAQTTGNMEETNDGVRKKKRKRKMSVAQDSVEKDQDFVDPNRTCQSALPETTDMRVKRKKKPMENESEMVTPLERLESAAEAGHSLTDETVLLKKKKKKKKKCKDEPCHVVQESPPKKKGKQLALPLVAKGCSVEVSHDGSTCDQVTKEALNTVEHASSSETPGNQTLNETMDKKKKKKKIKLTDDVLLEGNSLTKSGVLEPLKNKKKQSVVPNIISSSPMLSETSVLKSEISSSDRIMKNKHVKVKRRLHNPSEDFLTDC